MHKKKLTLILFIIISFSIFLLGFSYSVNKPLCSCFNFRILEFKHPLQRGNDVKILQQKLKQIGLYAGKTDGIFGKNTALSVKKFQKQLGFKPTGRVDFNTLIELNKILDKPVSLADDSEKPTGEIAILIEVDKRKLTVLADGKPFKQFPVAVGKIRTPTPVGKWKITQKARWGEGFGSRWMKLSVPWGVYGIHGTNKPYSIGNFASAGCVRMFNRHVEQVYEWVNMGTPVVITCNPYGPFTYGRRTLVRGEKGSDVMEVQKRLKGLGYYEGNIDGIFGWGMEKAVKEFQKDNDLKVTGQVTREVYNKLGLILFE